MSPRFVRQLRANGFSLVLADMRPPVRDVDAVVCDDAGGAYEATRHLAKLGHERIALIRGPARHPFFEALASGLPITCNRTPTLEWMTGPAGVPQDISQPGGLVAQWLHVTDPRTLDVYRAAARSHAEQNFSEPVVLLQIEQMYACVLRN